MGAVIAAVVPYAIPACAYAIGHIVGWFHHKLSSKVKQNAGTTNHT